MNLPNVVSAEEWEAQQAVPVQGEGDDRACDGLAAERRRQPIMRVEKELREGNA